MKTILNLKQYVILLVAAFAMTSCLDSDDPDFQFIGGGGYIIQVTPTTFFPMIAAYANEPMTNGYIIQVTPTTFFSYDCCVCK